MKKKSNTLLYVAISVGLILAAIAATTILNRTQEESPSDIRAKAGVANTLRVAGTVAAVDQAKGIFSVSNLQFVGGETATNLGSWTVTPPPEFSLSSLPPGTAVTLSIDPTTMLLDSRTVTANQIIVE